IDGQLDEAVYREIPPITDFIQQEPDEGEPVTEKTEAWILFDDENIYLVCRCWHSNPDAIVANDMRRDSPNLNTHDSFGVQLDPYHDGRSAFFFYMSPAGGIRDAAVVESRPNNDWDTIWAARATRFDQGWIAEIAIPFKSLRYGPGREQTWGIQVRRLIRSKNERVHLTRLSAAWAQGAWNRMAFAATLVGLEVPPGSRNLEIKPYGISSLSTDTQSVPAVNNEFSPDVGLDLKYGLTKGLTADFTYNTDFAQVEADEAQVNLTRFSLSFPEKRSFFLEGSGVFTFGAVTGTGRGTGEAPVIFYSRSIGLSGGRTVPVRAGGRLTGRAGAWSLGALDIQVGDDSLEKAVPTHFSVLRVRRNILRRSAVGAIFTRRSESTVGPGANLVWGLDANLSFYQHVNFGGYLAQSRTESLDGDTRSYRGQFSYDADRYGVQFDRLVVGEDFNPEVGFMRRENFRRNYAELRFSPRPASNPLVRKWTYQAQLDYITDNDNRLESRDARGELGALFHSGDSITLQAARIHEFLPRTFAIEGVSIPSGGHSFSTAVASYTAGQHHRVSGTTSVEAGGFYGGTRRTVSFSGRIEVSSRIGIEPNLSQNWIDLPEGQFTTTLVGARTTMTMTPRMFVAALVQYTSGSSSFSSNVRFRWEYQPGSELFVVYTEGRSTLPVRGTELLNRGVVVKITRLFRF
ncbi:MAG TPA: DUF5916 domain-containing protein, partial [Vicinamibacterales bacterium]|nr:DUF5916 domain-containing protein [Vicinamibacterales bacterium]